MAKKKEEVKATIKRCTKGHSWAVPWVGPDLGCVGFADVNNGVEVCTRCLLLMAVAQGVGVVQSDPVKE